MGNVDNGILDRKQAHGQVKRCEGYILIEVYLTMGGWRVR
jgi:hypothetical protein